MKKFLVVAALCIVTLYGHAQVEYFKGEWTKTGMNDLFTGIFKIDISKAGIVTGELIWIYLATDSADASMVRFYKGKKGRSGIEYAGGEFNSSTNDIYFEGKDKDDPDEILGLDKYTLKYSINRQVIYGITATDGTNKGMFYAIKMNKTAGAAAFNAAKKKLRK